MSNKPLAYDAYQKLAPHYAAKIDSKPHNAYYERPAMISMWPDLAGQNVLDAGCGPGVYAEELLSRGAQVTSIDVSDEMLKCARHRLGPNAVLMQVDMTQPLDMFGERTFDVVNAPLCLDYIEDWAAVLSEFQRVLKPNGILQFSCAHPMHDAEYFKTQCYFSVEQVECTWRGFGVDVVVPSFRRSFEEVIMAPLSCGFQIKRLVEPLPTEAFSQADPKRYKRLMHRPAFLCIQCVSTAK
ncbi:MAG: class I SAM-dependent methyltransferase [Pirellulaceae bacterium]